MARSLPCNPWTCSKEKGALVGISFFCWLLGLPSTFLHHPGSIPILYTFLSVHDPRFDKGYRAVSALQRALGLGHVCDATTQSVTASARDRFLLCRWYTVQDRPNQCVEARARKIGIHTAPTVGLRPVGIASENVMARAKRGDVIKVHSSRCFYMPPKQWFLATVARWCRTLTTLMHEISPRVRNCVKDGSTWCVCCSGAFICCCPRWVDGCFLSPFIDSLHSHFRLCGRQLEPEVHSSQANCGMKLHLKDLRRPDGFHANCLWQMLRIECAYVSRISNDCFRKMAGVSLSQEVWA